MSASVEGRNATSSTISLRELGNGASRPLTPEERQAIGDEVVRFLAEECELEPEQIGPDSDLVNELGVDSLTFLELFEELKSQYGLDTEARAVARAFKDNPVRTVGELVEQICLFCEGKIVLPPVDDTSF